MSVVKFQNLRDRNAFLTQRIGVDNANYTTVATELGLTRERVRQLANKIGVVGPRAHSVTGPKKMRKLAEKKRKHKQRIMYKKEAIAKILSLMRQGVPFTRAVDQTGVSPLTMTQWFRRLNLPTVMEGAKRLPLKRYDTEKARALVTTVGSFKELATAMEFPSAASARAFCRNHKLPNPKPEKRTTYVQTLAKKTRARTYYPWDEMNIGDSFITDQRGRWAMDKRNEDHTKTRFTHKKLDAERYQIFRVI